MSNWLIAGLLGLAILIPALTWSWTVRLRKDTTKAGMKTLASLNWTQFSQVVEQAMIARGLQPVNDEPPSSDAQPGQMMSQGDQLWLLTCKHGQAYRITAQTLEELASAARLRDAKGVILATEGQVTDEGLEAAAANGIEILSGHKLWEAVRNQLPAVLNQKIDKQAATNARRNSLVAVGASLCVAFTADAWIRAPEAANLAASSTPVSESLPTAVPSSTAVFTPASAELAVSEEALSLQRSDISKALPSIPGVIRGVWISKMTLVVDRTGEADMVWPRICNELARYPTLSTSRVQLNPRHGSTEPVRWRQCRTM